MGSYLQHMHPGEDQTESLKHYGVKGMKWGTRKDEVILRRLSRSAPLGAEGSTFKEMRESIKRDRQAWKDYKNSRTKEELRSDRKQATVDKFTSLFEDAKANPNYLLKTVGRDGYPVHMTGDEFVKRATRGEAFNISATEATNRYIGKREDR